MGNVIHSWLTKKLEDLKAPCRGWGMPSASQNYSDQSLIGGSERR